MAAASFIAAIPMIGDAIGGSAKLGLKGACLGNKIIFGSRAIAALGGFGLSLGQIYNNSKALAERLNKNGWKWDDESKALAGSIGINAIFALFSAKNAGDNINGFTTSQCFVAGTLVLTIEGNKPIEEIKDGDFVYSTDPETGESDYKEVVQTFENETEELVHISVAGEEIVTTPKHPFYVPHKGWTSAIDLRAGDILVLSNGEYVIVEKVQHEILESPVKVYNFEVQNFHTYYVGENSVLVHNQCEVLTWNEYQKENKGKTSTENSQGWADYKESHGLNTPTTTNSEHGNSLDYPGTNYGYVLKNPETGEILKYGESINPDRRYTDKYLKENNAEMYILTSGDKRTVHDWQRDMNNIYKNYMGEYPSLNDNGM